MKKAVIIYGPPGAGKGTQAELLAKKNNLIHFDTGRHLEHILHSKDVKNNKALLREKKFWDTGILNTPHWVLSILKKKVSELSRAGMSVVLSGSPRTRYEAFGEKNQEGLIALLTKLYGKKNIFIIHLKIDAGASITRNSGRFLCSVCNLPILASTSKPGRKRTELKIKTCSFCGGKAEKRTLDKPEIIKIRLKEYRSRTLPILNQLKKSGYHIFEIDGTKPPYKVAEAIAKILG